VRTILAIVAGLAFSCAGVFSQTNQLSPADQKRADLRIPELDRSALKPEKRMPTDVPQDERNPFGLLSVPPPEQEEAVVIEVETEEMKIRRVLGNMRVSGLVGQPGSYKVLLGPLQLGKGDVLPRLFPNQAEVLVVEDVSDNRVVLSFVERKRQNDVPPRTIALGIDLKPRVRSVLPGDLFTNVVEFDAKGAVSMKPQTTGSVDAILKSVESRQLTDGFTEHRRALLGEAYPRKEDESPAQTPAE
jgi:hypothetical protein